MLINYVIRPYKTHPTALAIRKDSRGELVITDTYDTYETFAENSAALVAGLKLFSETGDVTVSNEPYGQK